MQEISSKRNICVFSISNIILPTENLLSQFLGATTLDRFTEVFKKAINNPTIQAIILNIDSPGGAVTGVHECAEMIYQARSKKPITAYVSGMAASVAYWLASACHEIVIDATASVGSIGVLSIHTDDKAQKEKNGLVQTQIVSSQSPKKRLDIAADEGKADIQANVDAIAEVFVENVARNRNVSVETVLSDFGQGRLSVGIHAVKQGMADRLGSLEQLIQEKSEKANVATKFFSHPLTREKTMTDTLNVAEPPHITTEYLTAHHADLVKTFYQAGAQQERERIQAVEDQCMPGHEALIKTLKFDGKTTSAEAALQVLAAEKLSQSEKYAAFQTHSLSPLPIASSLEETQVNIMPKNTLSTEAQWRANWESDASLQVEFGAFETYAAFMKAQGHGRVNFLDKT
jgi:capsid assembly protease